MGNPSVWIKSATFSDGTTIEFNQNDFVVFVGPNNAGKSAALKNIKDKSTNNEHQGIVIKDLVIDTEGVETDLLNWLNNNCRKNLQNPSNPMYSRLGASVQTNQAKHHWSNNTNGLQQLGDFFVYFLTTDARLRTADPAPNIALTQDTLTHPIHYMQVDDSVEYKLSDYFRQAFRQDLIVHRNAGSKVPLHCGERPIPQKGQDRVSPDYIKSLEKLPTLHTQGDGMRAFVGVLLHALIVNHTVVLIDEPDAFLHPPQARLLGRMLIEHVPLNKQVFIATHSGDFLRGLLDSNSNRVRIIRIQRVEEVNIVKELDNTGIREVWGDPLLRYSNVLDGLFHEKVIVCEADSDCRFYAAIFDTISNDNNDIYKQDVMFIHCGGKARIPVVIKSLRNLGVPISVISDFDMLNAEKPLRPIYEALGGNWKDIFSNWSRVKTSIEEKKPELNSDEICREIQDELGNISGPIFPEVTKRNIQKIFRRSSPWSTAKEVGKQFIPSGEPTVACDRLFNQLEELGIFVVEYGELEGFARSIGGHGPKWVNSVLEKDLSGDPELRNAKIFVNKVISH